MHYRKWLTFLLPLSCLLSGATFAQIGPTVVGECWLVADVYTLSGGFAIVNANRTDTGKLNHSNLIDKASLNIALLNLKKNCCEHKDNPISKESCDADKPEFKDNVPQSYYLFDHLLDVFMRRLEGANYYDGVNPDVKGAERREYTTETAENIEGVVVQTVNNKYNTYRNVRPENRLQGGIQKLPENIGNKSRQEYLDIFTSEAGDNNLAILQRYPERTLGERYTNLCDIVGYTYFLLHSDLETVSSTSQIDLHAVNATRERLTNSSQLTNSNCGESKDMCNCLVAKKITAENTYAKYLATTKGNELLISNFRQYTNVYLTKRLQDLLTTIQNANTSFLRIKNATDKLISQCT